ncbi:unnamed protein product [Blepharisma stoltei]|uniref:LITAF domain-containing protein n=1 Tax=Blepharisma stoltei TaxID=1481888 RepID=A0AAU9JMI4_9CILI|nr:unnamed protein product [Blepharisma stoltei]
MSAEQPESYPPNQQPPQNQGQPAYFPMGQAPYQPQGAGMPPQYQNYPPQAYSQHPPYQPYPGNQPYGPGQPYPYQPNQAYPGQPIYNAQPAAPSAVIIESTVITTRVYGFEPIQVTCPYCHHTALTRIERTPGMMVWMMCLILLCLFPFCSCLPFCIPSLFDVNHYCGHCSKRLGIRRAL